MGTNYCKNLSVPFVKLYCVVTDMCCRGEDAYFVADSIFGIADGVGEWAAFGWSANAFSRDLMEKCKRESVNLTKSGTPSKTAVDILQKAYDAVPDNLWGACTALVGRLEGNILELASLGDSSALVLR